MNAVEIRRATTDDLDAILGLLQISMRRAHDARFDELFRWKHLDNAFGASPMWVACNGDRVVGFRVFMRWEFEQAGAIKRAVRAVDTATHPDYQGQGIFTRLTMHALDDVRSHGVDFVFNTPNEQSRPGYLKLGWRVIGRAPAFVRPTQIRTCSTMLRARTAASHWSEPTNIGLPAHAVLRETAPLEKLLAARPLSTQLRTHATAAVLAWRYGNSLLNYRAVPVSDDLVDGCAFVRVRRRGPAREAVLAELLFGEDCDRRQVVRRLVHAFRHEVDHVLAIGAVPGFVPLPRIGPLVTSRSAASDAPTSVREFDFSLGDLELF